MQLLRLAPATWRQVETGTQIQQAHFSEGFYVGFFFKVPSLQSPSKVHFVHLEVFCRKTSSSLWENRTASCCCYPKLWFTDSYHWDGVGLRRREEMGYRRQQLLLYWHWKICQGWLPQVQLPCYSYACEPSVSGDEVTDKVAQASSSSWRFSRYPHAVPRSLLSIRKVHGYLAREFDFKST